VERGAEAGRACDERLTAQESNNDHISASGLETLLAASRRTPMPVSVDWNELLLTFEFVSAGQPHEHEAVLCRKTGEFLWHTDLDEDIERWPDDADDEEKYLSIPHKKELDLGQPLVFEFVRQFLPDDFDEIRRIFDRRGAYARFNDLLQRRKALDRWYDFEAKATEAALREWCEVNKITIEAGDGAAPEPDRR
jgi:hypothetical protein